MIPWASTAKACNTRGRGCQTNKCSKRVTQSVKRSLVAVYQTRYLGQDCSAMPGTGLVFRRLVGIVSPFNGQLFPPIFSPRSPHLLPLRRTKRFVWLNQLSRCATVCEVLEAAMQCRTCSLSLEVRAFPFHVTVILIFMKQIITMIKIE